ncbi:MAG: DUF134 domain-containing protein [Oscillospiraceae bacterium]
MPGPRKCRRICSLPQTAAFQPLGKEDAGKVIITIDGFEAIRLIGLKGLTQELCAARMNVARTTARASYTGARGKLAGALVGGKALYISGGDLCICRGRSRLPLYVPWRGRLSKGRGKPRRPLLFLVSECASPENVIDI